MESVQMGWMDKERLRLEDLRRYYCMLQKRDDSHYYSSEAIGEWIEEVDQRLEEIQVTKKREEFFNGIRNLCEKFRSLDYYHVPKYAR